MVRELERVALGELIDPERFVGWAAPALVRAERARHHAGDQATGLAGDQAAGMPCSGRAGILDEMRKDVNVADQLYPIKMALIQLSEKLSDTYTVASSEAYTAALTVYNSAKRIKGLEGQSQAIADLGRRFERSGSAGAEPEPEAEPAAEPAAGSAGSAGSASSV